jgi:hypothetical protein
MLSVLLCLSQLYKPRCSTESGIISAWILYIFNTLKIYDISKTYTSCLGFLDFNLSWSPMSCFDHSWLVLTSHGQATWLQSLFAPLFCYCTDSSQLSQALVFQEVRLIASVLYAVRLSFNHSTYFMLPKIVHILLKINLPACYAFWCHFIFLFMVFCVWNQIGILNENEGRCW